MSTMNRKHTFFATALILCVALWLLVSCASVENLNPMTGIWQTTETFEDFRSEQFYTFTDSGTYVHEEWDTFDGVRELAYLEMGSYTFTDNEISMIEDGFEDYTDVRPYAVNGKVLVLDGQEYKLSSARAVDNTSADNLCGVWESNYGLLGFTNSGFTIFNYSHDTDEFIVRGTDIIVNSDGNGNPYRIINNKLYIGIYSFNYFGHFDGLVCARSTRGGKDTSSTSNLTRGMTQTNEWILVNVNYESQLFIYTFRSNGSYTRIDWDNSAAKETDRSSGTWTLDGHTIRLSDDGDLAYAIIDGKPFMFSI